MLNQETTMILKVEQFEGYKVYKFFEYGQAIGCLVVTRYGWNGFQVIHIDFNKNRLVTALELLADEYAKKGKALYCTPIPD